MSKEDEALQGMRVDKWCWVTRMVKTRTLAATMAKRGKILVNGAKVKPSRLVRKGEKVSVLYPDFEKCYEVVDFTPKRVSASVASTLFIDHTPPRERNNTVTIPIPNEKVIKNYDLLYL